MSQVKVTSAEVAALAGVSQSAVSRVFTPGASASAKTALKVRQAAVKLGYRPNSIARAMVSGKSRIIGLVVAYLENQFYPEALEKLSAMLQDRGYHVLIFMANTATDNLDEILDEILDYQVDGIVAASVALSQSSRNLGARRADSPPPRVGAPEALRQTQISAMRFARLPRSAQHHSLPQRSIPSLLRGTQCTVHTMIG